MAMNCSETDYPFQRNSDVKHSDQPDKHDQTWNEFNPMIYYSHWVSPVQNSLSNKLYYSLSDKSSMIKILLLATSDNDYIQKKLTVEHLQ